MYLDFFDLVVEPFAVTPDPEFLYFTPGYREALAAVVYGVEQRKGFILLVGEVGTGKTTILRASLAALQRRRVKPVYIFNAGISFAELLKTILREPETNDSVDKLLNRLHGRLVKEYKNGNNIAVIIDEAQNMTAETMENLRMLSNMETNKNKLLQIVLAGQPELDKTLERHELRQVKQRITIRAVTGNLSRSQSLEYIRHRIVKAGQDDVSYVFDRSALSAVVAFARGNPRVINMICDNALVSSYGIQQRPVTRQVVKEVIAEHGGRRWTIATPLRYGAAASAAFAAGVALTSLYEQWRQPGSAPTLADADAPAEAVAAAATLDSPGSEPSGFGRDPAQTDPPAEFTASPADPSLSRAAAARHGQSPASWPVGPPATGPVPATGPHGAAPSLSRQTAPAQAADGFSAEAVPPEIDLIAPRSTSVPRLPQQLGPALRDPAYQDSAHDDFARVTPPTTAEADVPRRQDFPVLRIVRSGDSLSSLTREVYGFYSADLVEKLRRFNPDLQDLNLIQIGDELLFPDLNTLTRQP